MPLAPHNALSFEPSREARRILSAAREASLISHHEADDILRLAVVGNSISFNLRLSALALKLDAAKP